MYTCTTTYINIGIPTYMLSNLELGILSCIYYLCNKFVYVYVYVYVYIIYHCGCTALPTRRLDHLIFVVRKTRNPLQLWDAPCSFQRVIHFSCGVEGSPRFLSSRQKRLYISSSCRHRCGTELIVLDLELPPRISSVLQLLHHPLSTHEYF